MELPSELQQQKGGQPQITIIRHPRGLVMDPENSMESENVEIDGALTGGDEMQFEEEPSAGGDNGPD